MVENLNFKAGGDRLPPQNIEAEESILGGILLDPEAINRVSEILQPEMFYISAHQQIYRGALELHRQGKPTDLMSVITWLADRDRLDAVGGQIKLAQLVDRTISAVNIDQYALLVLDKYVRRRLIYAGNDVVQLGYETASELPIVLDRAEQTIFNITQARPQNGLIPISQTLDRTYDELENRDRGSALPGLRSDFYDLDAMTGGFQRSDLIVVAGRPAMGKCLRADSEIILSDGSLSTIEEIYHRRYAELLTLTENWKFTFTKPSAFVDDGIKPVFRLTTRLGRFVETTITHPYLTVNGWKQLGELQPGDRIAVPRKIDIFGREKMPEYRVKLLAYLIGESCLSHSAPLFEEFTQAVTYFGEVEESIRPRSLRLATETQSENILTRWLQELGLGGKDDGEKTIPAIIFRLERSLISLFLNRLFAIDGWAGVQASGQAQLGYATVSEKLARQIQHLLLRFGIIAALKKQSVKYKGTAGETRNFASIQLEISDAQSIKTFISEIAIFGKEDALSAVQKTIDREKYRHNSDLIPVEIWEQIAKAKESEAWQFLTQKADIFKGDLSRERLFDGAIALDNLPLQQLATSDIYWDEIISIEPRGDAQVYDLTIPETHNFIANDICVHNTSFAVGIAHKIADLHQLPVAIFSLEMSKEQLVQRLLAGEAGIESNRLRAGRISQNEWDNLIGAIGTLSSLPIFIDDTPNITVTEMRSQARRLQTEQGRELGLILIDYLQLMEGANPDNRVQELSRITRSLKNLARELNVPVIALSQLSRGVESRTNKRPMMSDLRESGSIEQDADIVIMLYRDEYYSPDTPDRGIAEIIVAKHRNGPTGTIKLLFDPELTKFKNITTRNP